MVKFSHFAPRPKLATMAHLTLEQRYIIQALRGEGFSQVQIAQKIDKSKYVVCRELKRNCDQRSGNYRAVLAQKKCANRHKIKHKSVCFTSEIKNLVEKLLQEDYSPEQITGTLKRQGKSWVSHERIYQHIWYDKKQGGHLYKHLRTRGKRYRKRGAVKDKRGQTPDKVGIENRPIIVDEKIRFGDIEIDLVIGKSHKKALLTANDRATGMVKIALLDSKSSETTKTKLIEIISEWKPYLKTITSDNGKEFTLHKEIASALEIQYYFARPYHSWEREANENLNGLVRQYFPKNYDFNLITQNDIQHVEHKLNNRPRKRFGYLSPNQIYLQSIKNNGKVAFVT